MTNKFNNTIFTSKFYTKYGEDPIIIQQNVDNEKWIEIFYEGKIEHKLYICNKDIYEFIEVLKMFRDIIKQ